MANPFIIQINKKIKNTISILGYSKFFRWTFNNTVKTTQRLISRYLPRLKTRIFFNSSVSLKQEIINIRLLKIFSFKNNIRLTSSIIMRFKNRIKINSAVILGASATMRTRFFSHFKLQSAVRLGASAILRIRFFIRFSNLPPSIVRLKANITMRRSVFYKLVNWDYKPNTDPKEEYLLGELDEMMLSNMDFKVNYD